MMNVLKSSRSDLFLSVCGYNTHWTCCLRPVFVTSGSSLSTTLTSVSNAFTDFWGLTYFLSKFYQTNQQVSISLLSKIMDFLKVLIESIYCCEEWTMIKNLWIESLCLFLAMISDRRVTVCNAIEERERMQCIITSWSIFCASENDAGVYRCFLMYFWYWRANLRNSNEIKTWPRLQLNSWTRFSMGDPWEDRIVLLLYEPTEIFAKTWPKFYFGLLCVEGAATHLGSTDPRCFCRCRKLLSLSDCCQVGVCMWTANLLGTINWDTSGVKPGWEGVCTVALFWCHIWPPGGPKYWFLTTAAGRLL